ncbi:hypothetical protein BofuT4_uP134450.1 [Botrytis cinerea T4]|uniref:Uncharacterized protein n=1 Tax=Botryotinia fuckeliana (strain T4) TaxID=999810 RepID=G2YP52_BOTF4|nr:hypothetical protein BofuT4_uP134450.1 [Botrytis cinerea T4]
MPNAATKYSVYRNSTADMIPLAPREHPYQILSNALLGGSGNLALLETGDSHRFTDSKIQDCWEHKNPQCSSNHCSS